MIDLSGYSFEEWLDFVFDHIPVIRPGPEDTELIKRMAEGKLRFDYWWEKDEWMYTCESEILIKYMTVLFQDSRLLLSKYSLPEIDEGFSFMTSVDGFVPSFADDNVPWMKRRHCLYSIKDLFRDLFSEYEMQSSCYMWWDRLISHCAFGEKGLDTESYLFGAVANVILYIYNLDSKECKDSAAHGTEHMYFLTRKSRNPRIEEAFRNSGLERLALELDIPNTMY